MTDAQAERVVFDGLRADGVRFRHGGQERFARARAEVVLSSGSIGSAQLLQVSGVGHGPLLQSLGIPVVLDLSGVGENLQDHLQLRLIYRVRGAKTLNNMADRKSTRMKSSH